MNVRNIFLIVLVVVAITGIGYFWQQGLEQLALLGFAGCLAALISSLVGLIRNTARNAEDYIEDLAGTTIGLIKKSNPGNPGKEKRKKRRSELDEDVNNARAYRRDLKRIMLILRAEREKQADNR